MNRKTKVLFFLFGGPGGAERMTVNIAKILPRDRFEVLFVLCGRLRGIRSFIPSDYKIEQIPWINIHVFPHIRIAGVILKHKPDFVFSSTMCLNIIILRVASLLKVRCVVRNDNMLEWADSRLRAKIAKWYPKAYKVVAQQEEMALQIAECGVPNERITVLHNIIDIDTINVKLSNSENPYPDNGCVKYLCLNSFSRIKAQDITVKAFAALHSKDANNELYFVGQYTTENPVYRDVISFIEQNDLQGSVHIVGYVDNPYVWLKYADCLVSSSRLEGLPNSLIEAQYLGTPAVSTACIPIIKRIITDGVTGYAVPVDDIEAISSAMQAAPTLGRIKMTYVPSSAGNFIALFT